MALRIVVTPDEAAAAALVIGLQADAERQARLAHPGIIRPLAVFADGPLACVALELADGGNLGALRGAGFQVIVTAITQVVEALQYVHAQGLTHGDLKATNVLRDSQGRWRLTDFRSSALPEAGLPAVSLSTVSPQQLGGSPPTAADDIYSLGALLYDLLAGQPPLHPEITPGRIRSEVPEPLGADGQGQAVPAALAQLVSAMLQKSPERRPRSLGAVRALLAEIAADAARVSVQAGPAELRGVPDATPLVRPATIAPRAARLPLLVIVGFLVLLAVVLAVVFSLPRVVSERGPLVAVSARRRLSLRRRRQPPRPRSRIFAHWPMPRWLNASAPRMRPGPPMPSSGRGRRLEARRLAELGDEQLRDGDFLAATASLNQAADASGSWLRARPPPWRPR